MAKPSLSTPAAAAFSFREVASAHKEREHHERHRCHAQADSNAPRLSRRVLVWATRRVSRPREWCGTDRVHGYFQNFDPC